jgi:hypothetical protein
VCDPITAGVSQFATGAVSAFGQHSDQQAAYRSQVDAVNRQNEYTRRQWDYQLEERDRDWTNQLAIWNTKRAEYGQTLGQNASAADRAYASEQLRLNEAFNQAAFAQQGMLGQLVQGRGSIAASGQSGRSVAKMDQSALAAYGRNNALIAQNLSNSRNSMIRANEETRLGLNAANMNAWRSVQFAPQPTQAPPTPMLNGMPNKPSGWGLASGLMGAAVSGFGTYNSLKAPSGFSGDYKFNPNPGAAGVSPTGANYYGPAFGANYSPYTFAR